MNENPVGHPQGAWRFLQEIQTEAKTCLHENAWEDYQNCRRSVQEGESFSGARENRDAPVIYTQKIKEKE